MVSIIASSGNLDALLLKVTQGPAAQPSWCLDFRCTQSLKKWRHKVLSITHANSLGYFQYHCELFILHMDAFCARTSVQI